MRFNKDSGYGQFLPVQVIMGTRPSAGKIFVVGKAGLTYRDMYSDIFTGDVDGRLRFVSTIAAAATLCTADGNDQIALMPGHTETISSATALTLSTAGMTIFSLGTGGDRAIITLDTANTSTINVSGNNITISNVVFLANFASIAAVFTLTTAKDFVLQGCEFRDTSAILNFTNIVSTSATSNAADGLTIQGCKRFGAGADSNTTIVNMLGTNDRVSLGGEAPGQGNYWSHLAVTGGGLMIIATGKIVTNAIIRRNICNFLGSTGLTTGLLVTTNGTTNSGVIADNYDFNLDATTEILVTAGSGFIFFNNYHSGAADKSGYLLPAADV